MYEEVFKICTLSLYLNESIRNVVPCKLEICYSGYCYGAPPQLSSVLIEQSNLRYMLYSLIDKHQFWCVRDFVCLHTAVNQFYHGFQDFTSQTR